MAKVGLYNMTGEQVGNVELNDSVFGVEINEDVMHQVVVSQLANKRQGTQSAKTRSEVRGGGRKPHKQKGTGRARAGSIRQPNWVGGGVVFAPKPRDYSQKINKKMNRLALQSALTSRVNEAKMMVLENLELETFKTKEMKNVLNGLSLEKALVVVADKNDNVRLSARNLEGIKTASVNTINVYDILKYDNLVVTQEAVKLIEEVYA
ncbi:MAG: 50S ribosomal protein L4 [Clostridia bacterium]|jgi:large subunit ribosomal protein L4|nr:50S ribosomal protein L4 [Clostridia bacterium]